MWEVILENLLPLIVLLLTPVVTVFARKLLKSLAGKWHMESALQYEDKVEDLILKGIKAAEKKAMNALKKNAKDRTPGEQKLGEVMEFVNGNLKALKLDQKAANELEMLVEAKLFDGKPNQQLAAAKATKPVKKATK